MNQLLKLAELFSEYKLYPIECFDNTSIAYVFQQITHPNDPYSQDLKKIFSRQHYKPEQRGADLPYWGKNFFSEESRPRIMVISLDSNSKDAGSVVFHSCLWPYMDKKEYQEYIKTNKLILYKGYDKSKDLIQTLGLEHLYITDILKVYRKNSWKDKDFDKNLSIKLLLKEINICNPDLIVLLGRKTMELLEFKEKFSDVNGRVELSKGNRTYIVSNFPSGANRFFNSRVEPTKSFFQSTLKKFRH